MDLLVIRFTLSILPECLIWECIPQLCGICATLSTHLIFSKLPDLTSGRTLQLFPVFGTSFVL